MSRQPAAPPSARRRLETSVPSDNASDTPTELNRKGAPLPPLEQTNRYHRRPAKEPASYDPEIVHVAYRPSDLNAGHSRRQAKRGNGVEGWVSSPSASRSAEARAAQGRAFPGGAKRHADGALPLRARTSVRGARQQVQAPNKGEDEAMEESATVEQRELVADDAPSSRQRSLLASEAFRMPAVVGNGVGWGLDGGPFNVWPECPSSPRVLQIGIAMDTGYFKVCGL